jgi:hypothetical protein
VAATAQVVPVVLVLVAQVVPVAQAGPAVRAATALAPVRVRAAQALMAPSSAVAVEAPLPTPTTLPPAVVAQILLTVAAVVVRQAG